MSADTPASLYANKRASLVLALGLLGHKNAGELIDRAQRTADAIARCEMEGSLPLAQDDNEAEKLREHLPMLWDFVIAGHVGGGSGSTDAGIEAMQFQPTEGSHTPGPWRFHPSPSEQEGHIAISSANHCELATVYCNPDVVSKGEANARLIAAAPETAAERDRLALELRSASKLIKHQAEINAELLAALKETLRALVQEGWNKETGDTARAAIAKAEGRA